MLEFINSKKEKCKFALLYQIMGGDNPEVCTDNKNYFMARTDSEHPIWLWTNSKLTKIKLNEIKENLAKFLIKDKKIKCTCDKEIYDILRSENYKYLTDDYFEMGTYFCEKLIKPPVVDGKCRVAESKDIPTLVKFHKDNALEIDKVEITDEQSLKDITDVFDSKNRTFYVWENDSKKLVCMAVINKNGDFARINFVYTPEEERRKNYAKNLIYTLTQKVLGEKLLPILYTDFNYPASNKAYMAVGYESCGLLINFSCQKVLVQ